MLEQLSKRMRVASLLGAMALAASVFLLFQRYWGLLGSTPQVIVLMAASGLSYGLTL